MTRKPVNSPKTSEHRATDLLSVIREIYPGLSRSDKKIAQFLLETPERFADASVKKVARMAGVSDATVVRFGKNLGCSGFKDLKLIVVQYLATKQALTDAGQTPMASQTGSYVEQIHLSAVAVLAQAAHNLRLEKLDAAAQVVSRARRVFIYGTGGSSGILATELHNRLFRLGITTTAFTNNYLQRMSASTLGADDAIIIISSTGRPRSLHESMELARHYGAKCVVITDEDSVLSMQADVCVHVELSQFGVAHNQPNPMRFAQLLAIDCLCYQIAVLLGDTARESLERVRASVAAMHGIVSQQPIGD
jgi:DNA-binding MurR/RpiR family transcriptional regulator